ncbi:hypothetical protein [Paucibacter soli]|uniref:hypothetical protein n=1 Tax=Paucibacter soli TaxID=3133433 RepID=UPI0030A58C40
MSDISRRIKTARGGPHALRLESPATAPDSLIHELEAIADSDAGLDGPISKHFLLAGFTSADLALGPECNSVTCEEEWYRAVLAWDQAARPGEPGFWAESGPAPSIADRVIVCLHALSMPAGGAAQSYFPGAGERAQLVLNELLLSHPVLMHPRIRVRVRSLDGKTTETTSLAHAICTSTHGHLPRFSDWPAGAAPLDRLAAFANHPVTRLGLTTSQLTHRGQLKAAQFRTPIHAGYQFERELGAVIGNLVSLWELGRLADPGSKAGIFLDAWSAIDVGPGAGVLAPYLTSAMARLCGIGGSSTGNGPGPAWGAVDPDFIGLMRAQSMDSRALVAQGFSSLVESVVLGDMVAQQGPVHRSADEVEKHFVALAHLLVDTKLSTDLVSAARWIREQVQCEPETEVSAALGFIRTLRKHDLDFVDPAQPLGPGWVQALEIDRTERLMIEVIGSVTATGPAPSTRHRVSRAGL